MDVDHLRALGARTLALALAALDRGDTEAASHLTELALRYLDDAERAMPAQQQQQIPPRTE